MNGIKLGIAIVLFSGLAFAEPAPEFTEIHFAAASGPGVLAVTVLNREGSVWRLFPEEVKIEHTKHSMEYSLSYSSQTTLQGLIRTASNAKNISEPCKAELNALLQPPKTAISDDKLTTTVYIPLDDDHPERISLRVTGGLKVLTAEPLHSETALDTTDKSEMQPWTRAVYVNLAYTAGYNINYGISDLVVTEGPSKGAYRVTLQKTGLGPLKAFIADGALSISCADSLDRDYWAAPVDTSEPKYRNAKNVTVVIPMPSDAPVSVDVKASSEFTVKYLKPLE